MIDPITGLALGAQAATGLYQMYKGSKAAKDADRMRQDYQIPQQVIDTLTDAQIQSLEGMPAAQKSMLIQNLQGSTQSSINALSDRKAGISGVEGVYRNEQSGFNNLAAQDSAVRQANIANLQGVRNNLGAFEDKKYDINLHQPYMAKLQSAEALKGAGMQNTMGVLNSAAGMSQQNQIYQDILGKDKDPTDFLKTIENLNLSNDETTTGSAAIKNAGTMMLNSAAGMPQGFYTEPASINVGGNINNTDQFGNPIQNNQSMFNSNLFTINRNTGKIEIK